MLMLSIQSDTAKTINHFINQWDALLYYCKHRLTEIDNNIAENALRAVLGRNYAQFGAGLTGSPYGSAQLALPTIRYCQVCQTQIQMSGSGVRRKTWTTWR